MQYKPQDQNQCQFLIISIDKHPQEVNFYNLRGESYSNSFQAQVDQKIFTHFDMHLAFRWFDENTTYHNGLTIKRGV